MAPHSSTPAWKITWTEEPGRLQSMGSLRVWHDWATSLSLFTFMQWRRKWQPTQCSCLENPRDGWAAVSGVAQSRTRLKQLSSSSRGFYREISLEQTKNFKWLNPLDFWVWVISLLGLPKKHSGKEFTCQCKRLKRCVFDPWVGKNPR